MHPSFSVLVSLDGFVRPFSYVKMIYRTAVFTAEAAFNYLGLSVNSSVEDCRRAYLELARQLHPDARSSHEPFQESACKYDHECVPFQRLQAAYKIASEAAKARTSCTASVQRTALSETLNRHRAPQHRHFLEAESRQSRGGPVATGPCPADRYRQMQSHRFVEAAYASADYRVARLLAEITTEKSLSDQSSDRLSKFKSVNFIERVADDLISEAMDRGEFDNLPGQGKPIPREEFGAELFCDPAKIKITRILINQGYLPDWIQVNKQIRERWGKAVAKVSRLYASNPAGRKHATAIEEFREEVIQINRLIDRYNLMVPTIHLQRGHKNPDTVIQVMLHSNVEVGKSPNSSDSILASPPSEPEEKEPKEPRSKRLEQEEPHPKPKDDGKSFDTNILAEVVRDFCRELVRVFVSIMRGFKHHR